VLRRVPVAPKASDPEPPGSPPLLRAPRPDPSRDDVIVANAAEFRRLVGEAQRYAAEGDDEIAALFCETAAIFAISNHGGFFSSPELERTIGALARRLPLDKRRRPARPSRDMPQTVLHVGTDMYAIGGGSRLVWRWMAGDRTRQHSVAVTRQRARTFPQVLIDAVARSGGTLHDLRDAGSGFMQRAARLAAIASYFDIVVLHTECDIVPLLAFARPERSPPTLFVDHGDHKFRLGIASSSVVASLRESGMRLAQRRGDVHPARNALLPTLVEPAARRLSRPDAKRQLGFQEDDVVILCVARKIKFKAMGSLSFAGLHVPALRDHPEAVLVVIGPGPRPDWQQECDAAGIRLRALPEQDDTALFFEAADIYVDSHPFMSITSLLEAGTYGLPLLSFFPHPRSAEIFGADMPGLTGHLLQAGSPEEYAELLSRLISDEAYRLALGARTRTRITALHCEAGWSAALEQTYAKAMAMRADARRGRACDEPRLEDVDRIVPLVCVQGLRPEHALQQVLRGYGLPARLRYWLRIGSDIGWTGFLWQGALKGLAPENLLVGLRTARRRLTGE
jgi:glycosyltransferase involved in cell wall biosynthesis